MPLRHRSRRGELGWFHPIGLSGEIIFSSYTPLLGLRFHIFRAPPKVTLTRFLFALTIPFMKIKSAGFFRPDHDPPTVLFSSSAYRLLNL
jgi:hypothetical protein